MAKIAFGHQVVDTIDAPYTGDHLVFDEAPTIPVTDPSSALLALLVQAPSLHTVAQVAFDIRFYDAFFRWVESRKDDRLNARYDPPTARALMHMLSQGTLHNQFAQMVRHVAGEAVITDAFRNVVRQRMAAGEPLVDLASPAGQAAVFTALLYATSPEFRRRTTFTPAGLAGVTERVWDTAVAALPRQPSGVWQGVANTVRATLGPDPVVIPGVNQLNAGDPDAYLATLEESFSSAASVSPEFVRLAAKLVTIILAYVGYVSWDYKVDVKLPPRHPGTLVEWDMRVQAARAMSLHNALTSSGDQIKAESGAGAVEKTTKAREVINRAAYAMSGWGHDINEMIVEATAAYHDISRGYVYGFKADETTKAALAHVKDDNARVFADEPRLGDPVTLGVNFPGKAFAQLTALALMDPRITTLSGGEIARACFLVDELDGAGCKIRILGHNAPEDVGGTIALVKRDAASPTHFSLREDAMTQDFAGMLRTMVDPTPTIQAIHEFSLGERKRIHYYRSMVALNTATMYAALGRDLILTTDGRQLVARNLPLEVQRAMNVRDTALVNELAVYIAGRHPFSTTPSAKVNRMPIGELIALSGDHGHAFRAFHEIAVEAVWPVTPAVFQVGPDGPELVDDGHLVLNAGALSAFWNVDLTNLAVAPADDNRYYAKRDGEEWVLAERTLSDAQPRLIRNGVRATVQAPRARGVYEPVFMNVAPGVEEALARTRYLKTALADLMRPNLLATALPGGLCFLTVDGATVAGGAEAHASALGDVAVFAELTARSIAERTLQRILQNPFVRRVMRAGFVAGDETMAEGLAERLVPAGRDYVAAVMLGRAALEFAVDTVLVNFPNATEVLTTARSANLTSDALLRELRSVPNFPTIVKDALL